MNTLRTFYLLAILSLFCVSIAINAQSNDSCEPPESLTLNWLTALSWQSSNHLVAIASDDIVQIWDLTSSEVETEFIGESVLIQSLDWSANGQYLAVSGNQIVIWDIHDEQRLEFLPFPQYVGMGPVDWHPSENKFLFRRLTSPENPSGDHFYILDLDQNQIIPIGSTSNSISVGKWSPDGAFIAIVAYEVLRVYASDTYELVLELQLDNATNTHDLAWSFDNTRIAIGLFEIGFGPKIIIIDTITGEIIDEMRGFEGFIYSMDWHPSLDLLITGGDDKRFRIWDLVHGEAILLSEAYGERIIEVSWSSDGQSFISASRSGEVLIWDECHLSTDDN